MDFDDVCDRLTKYAAANNWLYSKKEAKSLLLEDGRNISYAVVIALFFLGLLTLWFFLVGVLFWIIIVVYAVKSSPHRIFIVSENGKYTIYANSSRGLDMARNFFISLGAKRAGLVEKEPSVEELYDELARRYVGIWGSSGKQRLEREIKNLIDRGIGREEAIKRIYYGRRD